MLNLTKEEKLVLIFFIASFLIGSGVNFYWKKSLLSPSPLPSPPKGREGNISFSPNETLEKININNANFNELIKLKGIGKKMASRIIDYRQKNGPFFYKEDLMKVKGIGRAKFEVIKKDIIIE